MTGRILVLDNKDPWDLFAAEVLRAEGFAVDIVSTFEQALEVGSKAPSGFDVVVVDSRFLSGEGQERLYDLLYRNDWTPMIVISTVPSCSEASVALRANAAEYIGKDYDGDDLLKAVDHVLALA